jgi:hypothetical protein
MLLAGTWQKTQNLPYFCVPLQHPAAKRHNPYPYSYDIKKTQQRWKEISRPSSQ